MGVGRYTIQAVLLLIALLGNIVMVFRTQRHFVIELLLVLVLLVVALVILAGTYTKSRWAAKLATFTYAVILINVLYLYMNSPKGILVTGSTVIVSCLGILFSLLVSQMTEDIQEIPRIEEYEQRGAGSEGIGLKTSGSRKVKRKRGRPSRKE